MENRTSVMLPALLALALGSVAVVKGMPALKSARPQAEGAVTILQQQPATKLQSVPARLWQDPLSAVYDHVRKIESASQTATCAHDRDDRSKSRSSPYEAARYTTVQSIVEELRKSLEREAGSPLEAIRILGVQVTGGHFVDDEENRLRSRRAIYAALSASGYAPLDSRNLGYFGVPRLRSAVEGAPARDVPGRPERRVQRSEGKCQAIPFEIFVDDVLRRSGTQGTAHADRHEGTPGVVVVLWLDGTYFERFPLRAYYEVLNPWQQILPRVSRSVGPWGGHQVSLIGPTDSDAFAGLFKNDARLSDSDREAYKSVLKTVWMYSPWATLTGIDLLSILGHRDLSRLEELRKEAQEFRARQCREECVPRRESTRLDGLFDFRELECGLAVERMVGEDQGLISLLLDELVARGLKLDGMGALEEDDYSRVALLIEFDSNYGRGLFETYVRMLVQRNRSDPRVLRSLDVFGYSKGMDGVIAIEERDVADVAAEPQVLTPGSKPATRNRQQPSAGRASLDYVRRVVARMKARGNYKAIGILGSDVYDKLVLLQALRSAFDSALFFTTDLDARLTDPAEYPTTRNLIIASHYGLSPGCEYSAGVPPFRGSYQTAVYISALAALGFRAAGNAAAHCAEGQEVADVLRDVAGHLKPRIYEIGKSGAFDLSRLPDDGLHPRGREIRALPTGLGAAGWIALTIGIGLLLLLRQLLNSQAERSGGNRWALYLLLGTVLAMSLYVGLVVKPLSGRANEEPFAIFEGISVWPSTILRLALVGLCFYYLFKMRKRLVRSNGEITDAMFPAEGDRVEEGRKPGGWSTEQAVEGGPWPRRWRWVGNLYRRLRPTHWGGHEEQDPPWAASLWGEYLGRGRRGRWVARIVILFLLCVSFGGLVIAGVGEPPMSPVRGVKSPFWHDLTLRVSVIAIWVLIAAVLATTALTLGLVRAFSRGRPKWSEAKQDEVMRAYDIPRSAADKWLAVELIGARTRVVERFVYYPFVAMFIMLVLRHSAFDAYSATPHLTFIQGIYIGCVVLVAVLLQRAGARTRERITEELQKTMRQEPEARPPGWGVDPRKSDTERIETLIERLGNYKEGAFSSVIGGPVVRALLIPGGGISLLFLLEYVMGRS